MFSNPFVNQLLAEERRRDAMRQGEKARLVKAAVGAGKPWRWPLQLMLALKSLLAAVH